MVGYVGSPGRGRAAPSMQLAPGARVGTIGDSIIQQALQGIFLTQQLDTLSRSEIGWAQALGGNFIHDNIMVASGTNSRQFIGHNNG